MRTVAGGLDLGKVYLDKLWPTVFPNLLDLFAPCLLELDAGGNMDRGEVRMDGLFPIALPGRIRVAETGLAVGSV